MLCTFLQFNALFCLRVTTYIHTFVYLLDKTYSFPKAEKKISYCIMCSVALIPSRSQNLKLFATANVRCNREIESENKSAIYSGMQHILKNWEFLNATNIKRSFLRKKSWKVHISKSAQFLVVSKVWFDVKILIYIVMYEIASSRLRILMLVINFFCTVLSAIDFCAHFCPL